MAAGGASVRNKTANAVTDEESIRIMGSPDSSHRILCCDTIETTIRRGRFSRYFGAPNTDGTEASERDFYATGGGRLPALLPKPAQGLAHPIGREQYADGLPAQAP